ncbi:MAG: hypothetical protein Q8M11_07615 [Sulfuritalea sp.]|nr:hypothetical protein [Sulfuritalea sp.]MDP1982256.1 hypothetical protein [Sulfuritalea sp.]
MRRFLHPMFALLLSLLLVGSQQAALAHVLGHAAATGPVRVVQEDDAGHGAVLALSHVCTTCIAFAGADAAPAASLPPPATPPGRMAAPALAVPPAPTLAFIAAFRSRAPPSL